MGIVDRTRAGLRFGGDDLDPTAITAALGREPTYARRAGDVWSTPSGQRRVARIGIWILDADEAEPGDLDRQVASLFAGLSEDMSVWQGLAKLYDGDIYTGLFLSQSNQGLNLSPLALSAIGIRGLTLGLEIYNMADD